MSSIDRYTKHISDQTRMSRPDYSSPTVDKKVESSNQVNRVNHYTSFISDQIRKETGGLAKPTT